MSGQLLDCFEKQVMQVIYHGWEIKMDYDTKRRSLIKVPTIMENDFQQHIHLTEDEIRAIQRYELPEVETIQMVRLPGSFNSHCDCDHNMEDIKKALFEQYALIVEEV